MHIKIVDYDLTELTAVVSIPARTPEPNTFTFGFDQWDVIQSAIDLGLVREPHDRDEGRSGQILRLGYTEAAFPWQQFNRTLKKPIYFTYEQIIQEFSGDDKEMIIRNLAMQHPEISTPILESI